MLTIHKYFLPPDNPITIEMPEGAKILSCQAQNESPQIWALVEDMAPMESKYFYVFGTGHEVTHTNPEQFALRFIDTFQISNDSQSFHVFEEIPK